MDAARNPFAPGAGTQPPELTGRAPILEQARVTLERVRAGRPSRSLVLVGLRGVGKTVLLNRIDAAARQGGYHPVLLEAPEERRLAELLAPTMRGLLLRLDFGKGARDKLRKAFAALRAFASTFKVSIGDIGVGIEPAAGTADSGALDSDVTDLLVAVGEAAAERTTPVALLIDELQYVQETELRALLSGLHRVGQMNLPIVLFGAGLPQLVGLTGRAKSYAERLFVFQEIGPLGGSDARAALEEPVEREGSRFTEDALDEIVRATEGYPYFLQEWGSHAWNHASRSPITLEDARAATAQAITALDQSFFRVRFDRLTPSERDYLRAMAELGRGPHRSGDVAVRLGRAVEHVAPARARVIAKGMAYAPAHGDIAFTVPMFDDYMRRIIPDFVPREPRKREKSPRS